MEGMAQDSRLLERLKTLFARLNTRLSPILRRIDGGNPLNLAALATAVGFVLVMLAMFVVVTFSDSTPNIDGDTSTLGSGENRSSSTLVVNTAAKQTPESNPVVTVPSINDTKQAREASIAIAEAYERITLPYSRDDILAFIPDDGFLKVTHESQGAIILADRDNTFLWEIQGNQRVSHVATFGVFGSTDEAKYRRGILYSLFVASKLAPGMLFHDDGALSEWFRDALRITEQNPNHTVTGNFGDVEVNIQNILKWGVLITYRRHIDVRLVDQ